MAQYGYGALMGTIGMDMTASTPTYVGGFNASISGDGFFMVKPIKTTATPDSDGVKTNEFLFTRVGQFTLDNNGYVVDGDQNFVYGFYPEEDGDGYKTDNLVPLRMPTLAELTAGLGTTDGVNPTFNATTYPSASDTNAANHPLISKKVSINSAGDISVTAEYTDPVTQKKETKTISLGAVAVATFQNPNGVTKSGGNYYTTSKNDNAGNASAGIPGGVNPALMTGYVEASNVDLAKEFADMITTHRGFQSNTKMITVSDEMLSDLVAMKR